VAKFCIQCGAELNPSAKFCGECGTAVADDTAEVAEQSFEAESRSDTRTIQWSVDPGEGMVTSPSVETGQDDDAGFSDALGDADNGARKPNWLLIGGAVAILLLLLAYYLIFIRDDVGSKSSAEPPQVAGAASEEAETKQYYVVAEANIRDKATAQGSTVIGKMPRGTAVSGKMALGEDGTSDWLELEDGKGFIGAVNLSETKPPEIVKQLGDKTWTTDRAVEIWSQPDSAATVIDRLAAGTQVKLFGLTANDYIEIKLRRGGVGYLAGGARILAIANGKPIALAFNSDSCSFGPEIDAMFVTMGDRIRAKYKELENRDYASEEERERALIASEGKSTFEKLQRSYEGLTVVGIAQHYESNSVYFAEPAAQVIAVLREKGYKIGKNGQFPSADYSAGVGATAGESKTYGATELSCGV
jgi:uncharacterized protein YgiM (DUF1202 family)